MDWAAVAAISAAGGIVLAAAPRVAAAGRRARLRARMRQALELLKELPEGDHDELRQALTEVAAFTGQKLAGIESTWLAVERNLRSRIERAALLYLGWQTLIVAALAVWQAVRHPQFPLDWSNVVITAFVGASFLLMANRRMLVHGRHQVREWIYGGLDRVILGPLRLVLLLVRLFLRLVSEADKARLTRQSRRRSLNIGQPEGGEAPSPSADLLGDRRRHVL